MRCSVSVPNYIEIINVTRMCSNILVAITERWVVARGSCDVFDRLSSAIISDAIASELQLKAKLVRTSSL